MLVVKNTVLKILSWEWLLTVVGLGIYLALVSTSPWNDSHILYNAEPYPDGLFYINAAQNIAQHGRFEVTYQDAQIKPYITPLYSVVLAVGYLIHPVPTFYYVVNVLLGVGTILCILSLLKEMSSSKIVQTFGLFVYLGHAHIYWLPSLPMAENAVLFFFTASLVALFKAKIGSSALWLSAGLIGVLVLIKYTLFPIAMVMALFLYLSLLKKRAWVSLAQITIIFMVCFGLFVAYQISIGFNPLTIFLNKSVAEEVTANSELFYSTHFIQRNMRLYGMALLGSKAQFLWLNLPVYSAGISLLFGLSLLYVGIKYKISTAWLLLGLFVAQFPLLLIFYVVDMRYMILTQVMFAAGITLGLEKSRQKWLYVLVGIAVVVQMLMQFQLFKQIIATNWLHRSVAWQYEAVKGFNHFIETNPQGNQVFIITSLPPLLVELYATGNYHLLPLSPTQEFANKGQYIWGDDVLYENLPATYHELLKSGNDVFVSNAYLTSQHEFGDYFEKLKDEFTIELVQTGCLETCNLYKLSLK